MMKRELLIPILIAGLIAVAAIFIIPIFLSTQGGPIPNPNEHGWSRLTKGMSKAEVRSILGKSWHEVDRGVFEFWEYGRSGGDDVPVPEREAYVVLFDSAGVLIAWRAPISSSDAWDPILE